MYNFMLSNNFKSMEVYYINLQKSIFRNKRFLKEGATYFKNLQRYEAVDGSKINLLDCLANYTLSLRGYYSIKNQERIHKDDIGTLGALGCYLSHVGVWKKFLKSDCEHCLIFEDDADVKLEDALKIDAYMKNPSKYDVILFHRNQAIQNNVTSFFGTYAYSISRSGAKKLLKGVFPATQQIDAYMSNNILQKGLIIKNATEIQVGHHLSFGFSDVGHWQIYKNYIIFGIIFFIIFALILKKQLI